MHSKSGGRRGRLMTTATGAIALLAASSTLAYAQQTPNTNTDDDGNVIVVTGYRASLASSTQAKRNSGEIVEAVTAEDIGKLPDNSIAESLARLPGLTAQRLFGRAQVISVRGLSPDFTTALLNGREQVSAGDNRSVEFDQFPSELLNQVLVYKTPSASLIGQGLAGTADMRTVRPLDVRERVFAASARYESNELGALNEGTDDSGYRLTASYIDHSADGRWGWAIGVADMSSPTQAERWEAWGYPTTGAGELVIGGAKPYVQSSLLDRTGYMGVLQFRPSETFQTSLDVFYSEFDEKQTLRGIELPLFWGNATLQPGYTVNNGLVTAGTWTGVEGVVRNDVRSRNATVEALGWNASWTPAGPWTFGLDLSYSKVERHDVDLELYAGTGPGQNTGARDTMGFSETDGGGFIFTSVLDYGNPALVQLTDPQGWGQAGYIKRPETTDELRAVRMTAERELNGAPFRSWVFGYNHSERTKDHTSVEDFIDLIGGNNQLVPVPAQFLQTPTSLGFLGINRTLSFDAQALFDSGLVYTLRPLLNSDVIVKTWGIEEKVDVFFTQLNVDTELGGGPVTGNVGIQFVNTDQSSTGGVATATGPQSADAGEKYLEMLPSLNLAWQFMDDTYLRVGIARTLSRPRMDDMRASFAIGYNTAAINSTNPNNSYWSGNGGNPHLHPWIADSFDLSLEKYFGGAGYVSTAVFYKKLENYIYTATDLFDFTGFPVQNVGDNPAIRVGSATVPRNATGGNIHGLEFTAQLQLETLTPALHGFGVSFNGAWTDSNIQVPGNPASALPGLSETVLNTTVFYENNGFEARVSNRYRDDFLGEVTGFGAGRTLRFVKGESVLDAQLGYRFQSGALEGLAIQLQANNITDEPFTSYANGDPRQVLDYQQYGSTYLIGLSYRR